MEVTTVVRKLEISHVLACNNHVASLQPMFHPSLQKKKKKNNTLFAGVGRSPRGYVKLQPAATLWTQVQESEGAQSGEIRLGTKETPQSTY